MRSRAIVSLLALAPLVFVACSTSDSTYASLCPANAPTLPTCPVAPGAMDCAGLEIGCGLDALPIGLSCSGHAQCSAPIDPCPDWQKYIGGERIDGYICSCVNDRWSCDDCWLGEGLCQEAPDGASLYPLPAADAGLDGPATGESAVERGADGAFKFAAAEPLGQNDDCLPQPLPTDSSGETTCALVLEGLGGTCAAVGLSPATPQELALLGGGGPLPAGSTCELSQLAGSPGVGCRDQQETGWCYVPGSCSADTGATCPAALCVTTAFNAVYTSPSDGGGVVSVLMCP